jgi:hypothetical protein
VRLGLNWILVVVAMAAFLGVVGIAITGRVFGVLINDQRIMSLSRFQMVLWTLIIISGYFVIVVARIKQGDVANPLAVVIDPQVWALLGISTTALVGSPLIASSKKQKKPEDGAVEAAGRPYDEDKKEVEAARVGVLYPNRDPKDARFTDMFEGEELSNASLVDLAKVQMFFVTIVVALSYSAELVHMIMVNDLAADDVSLPTIHEGLLALMGISQAGYLGGKSITQTPTASDSKTSTANTTKTRRATK